MSQKEIDNLLTVAIPSYKRPDTLKQVLLQLKEQSNKNFRIIVADDSADKKYTAVEKVVTSLDKEIPNLKYIRNKTNLGFNENVCNLYDLVETRYVWFVCDDDTVLPGAIEAIVNSLIKHEPSAAVFNFMQTNPYGVKDTVGAKKDKLYSKLSDLKNDYQPLMRTTFLSIDVLEKSLSTEEIKKTNYKDNVYFQVTLTLMLLSKRFKFVEIAFPILQRNVGYKYGDFIKFYLIDHLKAVYLVDTIFDNEQFIKWSKNNLWSAFKLYYSQKIGLFRYEAPPTLETIKQTFKFYKLHSVFIFAFMLFSYLVPKFIPRTYYFLKLVKIHGIEKGKEIYKEYVDRAFTDKRKTAFTTYR